MDNNQRLYFLGIWSKVIELLGAMLIVPGIIVVVFYSWIIGLAMILVGGIIILLGKSKQFAFRRESGLIIYPSNN